MIRIIIGDDNLKRSLSEEERAHEDTKAELEAERRRHRITEAERDALADVHARDRERIRSEIAAYARSRAESEGPDDVPLTD